MMLQFNHWVIPLLKEKNKPTKVGLLYIEGELEIPVITFNKIDQSFEEVQRQVDEKIKTKVLISKDKKWHYETTGIRENFYPAKLVVENEKGSLSFVDLATFLNSFFVKQFNEGIIKHLHSLI